MTLLLQTKQAGLLCIVAVCSIASGCEPGPLRNERTEPAPAATEPDPTGQRHTLCGVSWGIPVTYSFVLMNRKLTKYPALAAAIGMNRVSSCDEARAFMSAYYRYREKHPEID